MYKQVIVECACNDNSNVKQMVFKNVSTEAFWSECQNLASYFADINNL